MEFYGDFMGFYGDFMGFNGIYADLSLKGCCRLTVVDISMIYL